jgi:hypothetical protein
VALSNLWASRNEQELQLFWSLIHGRHHPLSRMRVVALKPLKKRDTRPHSAGMNRAASDA